MHNHHHYYHHPVQQQQKQENDGTEIIRNIDSKLTSTAHLLHHHHHHQNDTNFKRTNNNNNNNMTSIIIDYDSQQQKLHTPMLLSSSNSSAFEPYRSKRVIYNIKRKSNGFTCQNITHRLTAGCIQLFKQIETRGLPSFVHQNQQNLTCTTTGAILLPQNPTKSFPLLLARYQYIRQIAKGGFSQIILAEDTFFQCKMNDNARTCSSNGSSSSNSGSNNGRSPSSSAVPSGHHSLGNNSNNRAYSSSNQRIVAIKIMNAKWSSIGEEESKMLRRLYGADPHFSANIGRLYHTFYFQQHFCLVFELLGDNLLTRTRHYAPGSISLHQIRKVASQLLGTLCMLKNEGVIHADLKPENILLRHSTFTAGGDESRGRLSIKMVDFGNAIDYRNGDVKKYYKDFKCQTLSYRAPEVIFGLPFDCAIDMWSLGVILVELYMGKPLFQCSEPSMLICLMQSLLGPLPHKFFSSGKLYSRYFPNIGTERIPDPYSKQKIFGKLCQYLQIQDVHFCSFIQGLLNYYPSERLTPEEALSHPFLSPLFPYSALLKARVRTPITGSPSLLQTTDTKTNNTTPIRQGFKNSEVFASPAMTTPRPSRHHSFIIPSQSPAASSASNSLTSNPSPTMRSMYTTPPTHGSNSYSPRQHRSGGYSQAPHAISNSQQYISEGDWTLSSMNSTPVMKPAAYYHPNQAYPQQQSTVGKRKYEEFISEDPSTMAPMGELKRPRYISQQLPQEAMHHHQQQPIYAYTTPDRSTLMYHHVDPIIPESIPSAGTAPISPMPLHVPPVVVPVQPNINYNHNQQQMVKTTTTTTMISAAGTTGHAAAIPPPVVSSIPTSASYHQPSIPTRTQQQHYHQHPSNYYPHDHPQYSTEDLHSTSAGSYHHHNRAPPQASHVNNQDSHGLHLSTSSGVHGPAPPLPTHVITRERQDVLYPQHEQQQGSVYFYHQ